MPSAKTTVAERLAWQEQFFLHIVGVGFIFRAKNATSGRRPERHDCYAVALGQSTSSFGQTRRACGGGIWYYPLEKSCNGSVAQMGATCSSNHVKRSRALRLATARNRRPIMMARHQLFFVHIVLNISGDMDGYVCCMPGRTNARRKERSEEREDVHQAQSIISMSQDEDESTDHRMGGFTLALSMCGASYGS